MTRADRMMKKGKTMAKKDPPPDPKRAPLCAWCNSRLATRADGLCSQCGKLADDLERKNR